MSGEHSDYNFTWIHTANLIFSTLSKCDSIIDIRQAMGQTQLTIKTRSAMVF